MRVWIGRSILVIALIHTVFGVVFLGGAFAQALRTGLFATVTLTSRSEVAAAFWFFVSGTLAFMLGGLVDHLEHLGLAFPAFLPWSLLVLTIVGCVLMPVSAWWLLFAPAAGMFVRGRQTASGGHDANG